MSRGVLIFAHNGKIDYGTQAVIAAMYVAKHLGVPTSIVTDDETASTIDNDYGLGYFDRVIMNTPSNDNIRLLFNHEGVHEIVEFKNSNRSSAFDLSPYEQTLVIDSDLLICSKNWDRCWNSGFDFNIQMGALDGATIADGTHSYKISEFSIPMLWATSMMFTKSEETQTLFDLVDEVKANYNYYAQIYEFDASRYRNDYVFSIACHLMSGMTGDRWFGSLPIPALIKDTDYLVDVKSSSQFVFLSKDSKSGDYFLTNVVDQDVHFINKRDMLQHATKLIGIL